MVARIQKERVIWQGFPSWRQFSWLYIFFILTAGRGLLFLRWGLPGWQTWLGGSLVLLLIIVILRHWVCYILTSTKVVISNAYTRRVLASMKLEKVQHIEYLQGPVDKFLGIGTLLIQSSEGEQELRLRGIKDPDVVAAKIRALV